MKIVYLEPRSSFRMNLRSDTLWGMICWGISMIYSREKLEEFIRGYEEGKVVKISSAFPYKKNEDGFRKEYFPKPTFKPFNIYEYFSQKNIDSKADKTSVISRAKKFKKVNFVPKEIFEKFLNGEITEYDYFEDDSWITEELSFWSKEEVLHNTINRLTNTTSAESGEASLYTTLEYFPKNSGLFFLIEGDEESLKLVEGSLNYLNHFGFGGDASIGKNSFKVSMEDFELNKPAEAEGFVNLSLYAPGEEESGFFSENKENCWYTIEARKGKFGGRFIQTVNFWKDSVLMFREGSVFKSMKKANYGTNKIVLTKDKTSDFDVYHYGYSFDLPIKLK